MSKKILYEEIYQKTQNCGRTQFVKLLQQNQIKIEQLEKENTQLKETLKGTTHCYDEEEHQRLIKENEELKKQIEIKNSGFMASIEEVCEYAIVLIKFEKWLEEELKIVYRDCGHKHNILQEVMNKLQELKGE